MTSLLGTRADGPASGRLRATIKVADRGHDASKTLPEYWRTDGPATTTSPATSAASRTCSPRSTRRPTPAARWAADHPVSWCKDYQGGRSFYTGVGNTRRGVAHDDRLLEHLSGAIAWTAGVADPVYSDCGATVLANYQQTKISRAAEPQRADRLRQLPDGRILQTARGGQRAPARPGDGPVHGHRSTCARTRTPTARTASTARRSTTTSPPTSGCTCTTRRRPCSIKKCDGTIADVTTPTGRADDRAPTRASGGHLAGLLPALALQVRRGQRHTPVAGPRQRAEDHAGRRTTAGRAATSPATSTSTSHNNLWLVTGDDTPAGGGNSGGFSPHNDQKTDETQTVRVNNATGGTFTLTFDGQTTAPIAYNATARGDPGGARGARERRPGRRASSRGGPVNTANVDRAWRGAYTTNRTSPS